MIALLDKVTAKSEKKQIVQEAYFKRAENHLSSITIRIPPEILGYIFDLAIPREYSLHSVKEFDGLEKWSYNFLLVCHHWSQVAFSTPKLWRFWGNTFQDWNKRYHLSGNTSVDLVLNLNTHQKEELSVSLQGQLRDHITQDNIRLIHLQDGDTHPIDPILSLLTPNGEGIQEKKIESISFNALHSHVDLKNFFARLHLPFLQYLSIYGTFQVPLWDHPPQTTHLTILSLDLSKSQSQTQLPPVPQLLSILNANPNLQDLLLCGESSGRVENTGVQVPLLHLKTINLEGEFTFMFQLLKQLQIPAMLDDTTLIMTGTTLPNITSALVPYMQNLFQCDLRFKEQAFVTTSFDYYFAGIAVTIFHESPTQEQQWPTRQRWPRVKIYTYQTKPLPHTLPGPIVDLMKGVPLEYVKVLGTKYAPGMQEELFNAMPKLKYLRLENCQDLGFRTGFFFYF